MASSAWGIAPYDTSVTKRENCEHAEKSDHGGPPDIGALLGVAGVDAGTFDAEEHEHRDQHRAFGLLEDRRERLVVAAPEVVGEVAAVELDHGEHDEHQDRHHLGDGDDPVDDRRLLYAPRNQQVEDPHPTLDTRTATTVSPVPRAGNSALVVVMITTQYDTLPAHAEAQ